MSERIPYEQYYAHALQLNATEVRLQAQLVPQLPDTIVDAHVHAGSAQHYTPDTMTDTVYGHMMSTFPVATLETSLQLDEALLPGVTVRKVRFAHAFGGVDHFGITDYLLDSSPEGDAVAAFGLSGSEEEIDKTADTLRDPRIAGLKVYYLSSGVALSGLYDYSPRVALQAAEEAGKPIILHLPHSIYNSGQEVAELATDYPDLKIILAHVGVAHIPRQGLDGILESLAAYPNVYADTAHVHSPELVAAAVHALGSDRVVYGSDEPLNLLRAVIYDNPRLGPRILTDYPYHWVDSKEYEEFIGQIDPGSFVHSQWQQLRAVLGGIASAGLTTVERDAAKHRIFHDNAERLFGLN